MTDYNCPNCALQLNESPELQKLGSQNSRTQEARESVTYICPKCDVETYHMKWVNS